MLNLVPKSVGKDIFSLIQQPTSWKIASLQCCRKADWCQRTTNIPGDPSQSYHRFWYTGKVPEFVSRAAWDQVSQHGRASVDFSGATTNCWWLFCHGSLGHRLCINHHCKWVLLSDFFRYILQLSPNRKSGTRLDSALEWVAGIYLKYPDFPCNLIPTDGKEEQVILHCIPTVELNYLLLSITWTSARWIQ